MGNGALQPFRRSHFRRWLVTVAGCWIVGTSPCEGPSAPIASFTFGLTLTTGMNNELFTLFIVKEFEGQVIAQEPVSRGQFVQQAQGVVPSKANPSGENLFRKFKVNSCLPPPELDDDRVIITDCGVFDNLWKLRFWEYPFRLSEGVHPGKGWSEEEFAPSARQKLLLSDYGILHMHSMAKGDDVFRLLRDIGDSTWVDNYRKGY